MSNYARPSSNIPNVRDSAPATRSVFARFAPRLQHKITSNLGWTRLREVQQRAGHAILDGKNAVVLAPTAGGKTEAALFPVLSTLISEDGHDLRALYVAPTRALLNNQEERLGRYTQMVGKDRFLWHGDVKPSARRRFLQSPCELLMSTPESLEVMLVSRKVEKHTLFANLRFIIIDEVHALAGDERGAHLMSVLERIAAYSQHDVQRIGLSATVGNAHAILEWLCGSSARKGVVVDPSRREEESLVTVHLDANEEHLAARAARIAAGKKSLFFCQSRKLTEGFAEGLRAEGTSVHVHHSSVSLEERILAEATFKTSDDATIVCTSTLELGIDVGDLDEVYLHDPPRTVSAYLQRMGRTGRRPGSKRNTTFFCSGESRVVQAIALVELAKEGWVEDITPNPRCWPVLVHQLLALTLQHGAVTRAHAWSQLRRVPDFSGIREDEFHALVDHMCERDYLYETRCGNGSAQLAMGQQAERHFGYRHFKELYSVFWSHEPYVVSDAEGNEIGSLEPYFAEGLKEGGKPFLLAGRPWRPSTIDHRRRSIVVRLDEDADVPNWGVRSPYTLSFEICQRIRQILESNDVPRYLSPDAAKALSNHRDAHKKRSENPIAKRFVWHTYAGLRINDTLSAALHSITGWHIETNNFAIVMQDDDRSPEPAALDAAFDSLRASDFWQGGRRALELPPLRANQRLSKFQALLPARFQSEMLAAHIFDITSAMRFMGIEEISEPAAERPRFEPILLPVRALRETSTPEPEAPRAAALDPSDAEHILQCLRAGAVPERGLELFACGVENARAELRRQLDLAASGEGCIKFLRGAYGCGKTFMAQMAMHDAIGLGLVTSFVVVSESDLQLHRYDDLYRAIVTNLRTSASERGLLPVFDRWLERLANELEADPTQRAGTRPSASFDERVRARLRQQLGRIDMPEDVERVVSAIVTHLQRGERPEASALISWLSGSSNVAPSLRKSAGIKGDITSKTALSYLRSLVQLLRAAGHAGLLVVIDEAETILRTRSNDRARSLSAIRQITDAASTNPGLLWLLSGTPEIFDERRGVAGLEPLHERIRFEHQGRFTSLRQPQLQLRPFDRQRLQAVAHDLREVYAQSATHPARIRARITSAFIQNLAQAATQGLQNQTGTPPRPFLRTFITHLDLVDEHEDYDPMKECGFEPNRRSA